MAYHMSRYVSDLPSCHEVGTPVSWEQLGNAYGAQDAPYLHTPLSKPYSAILEYKPACSVCGKRRDRFTITRSGVYCARCYDPARDGEPSAHTHVLATDSVDPDTCPHARKGDDSFPDPPVSPFDKEPVYHRYVYCLDCGARLRRIYDSAWG